MNKKQTLIIGGSTSISGPILEKFINNDHEVASTYYTNKPEKKAVNWIELDCNSD